MTNEEKARELAIKYTRDINENGVEVYNVMCEAALQEMAKWKDEQLPADAIIIGGTVYSFDHSITEGNPCDICDLCEFCSPTYGDPLCAIFGPDAENICFKKERR